MKSFKKKVVGFAVMGVIAASGLLIVPSVSEAGVRSPLLFEPLPLGDVSQYRVQAKAPQGKEIIRPEENNNKKVTPPRDDRNQKVVARVVNTFSYRKLSSSFFI